MYDCNMKVEAEMYGENKIIEKKKDKNIACSLIWEHTHTKKADEWLFGRMGQVDTGRMKEWEWKHNNTMKMS